MDWALCSRHQSRRPPPTEALALPRLVAEVEGYGEVGHALAGIWSSPNFQSDLDEAGDDPVARAYIYYDAEIEAYPFTLGAVTEASEDGSEAK